VKEAKLKKTLVLLYGLGMGVLSSFLATWLSRNFENMRVLRTRVVYL
jgi:hypothetical protein